MNDKLISLITKSLMPYLLPWSKRKHGGFTNFPEEYEQVIRKARTESTKAVRACDSVLKKVLSQKGIFQWKMTLHVLITIKTTRRQKAKDYIR